MAQQTMITFIGGIIFGYFIRPYIDIVILIIKNTFKNK
jgi:hypothetical protein